MSATGSLAWTPGSVALGLPRASVASAATQDHTIVTSQDFEDVFRSAYPRLVGLLTAACGDRELAADCVQEAFVRAHLQWRKIGHYDDPVAWVRRVALNLVRDHSRRSERGRRARGRWASARRAEDEATVAPDQPVDLLGALHTLPSQQRITLALHYVEGLAVREIAEELSISEGTVKFHLHVGRERFRESVDEAREDRAMRKDTP